jgi:ABC-type branched-subunit amino acid transport system substrate-binding protein
MKIKILLFFLMLFSPLHVHGAFNTLADLEEYAWRQNEYPKSDNNDWLDPEYVCFYEHLTNNKWDWRQLEQLLKKLATKRATVGFETIITKQIEQKDGDRLFVWGDLHGAFHSLVRGLRELHKMGVMREDLTLADPNKKLVFIGDLVSRSPYSLEALHAVLVLMDKNPGQVIYLRGKHERKSHWEGFSMRRSLKVRLKRLWGSIFNRVPLVDEINAFFATLFDVLVVKHAGNGEKMCVSHPRLSRELLGDMNMQFVLHGEQRIGVVQETLGLKFIGNLAHVARWSLMSCPVEMYKRFFNFDDDSFVEVLIGDSMSTSVLTHYNRDAIKDKSFRQTFYNPVFGYELKKKQNIIKGKEIVMVGCTMSLSGITGPLGRETTAGVESAIQNFNKEENETLIRPVVFDDGYVPRRAFSNVKKLYDKYGIDMILVPTGTPTLSFYLNMVKTGRISVLFPYTGASQFRKRGLTNMIHFRASYLQEVEHTIEYLIKNRGIKNFALFYQDDAFGAPIAKAARKVLKRHGITKWLDLPHLRTQIDFDTQVDKIREFMPEAIGCFSTHFPTVEMVSQLGTKYFLGRMLFGLSFLHSDAFHVFLRDRGIKSTFSSVVPDPKTSKLDIAKEHIRDMLRLGKYASVNSFEAYIGTQLFLDAIKNIGHSVTKDKVLLYFEEMKNYDFKGFRFGRRRKSG